MKLRIRAFDSKETIRIDVLNDSTLQFLKQSISQAIGFHSPHSLRLSLNRTDELFPSSPSESLSSLGIAGGDLIFYCVVPESDSHGHEALGASSSVSSGLEQAPNHTTGRETIQEIIDIDETLGASSSASPGQESAWIGRETIEMTGGGGDISEYNGGDDETGRFPESCFVKRLIRVLSDDLGEEPSDHKLIICSVHSVFLESGFVGLSGDKPQFPSTMDFSMSLHYTLPEISPETRTESAVLKFQTMKNFVTVYGSLTTPGSPTYRICLDERRFAPGISSLRDHLSERALFELWRETKDGVATPLMIELCSRAGLAGPACLARLPSELQTRILEFLPGVDLARAACASKDLHQLTRDEELWRRKFAEEFSAAVAEPGWVGMPWRTMYAKTWQIRREDRDLAAARRRRVARRGPLFGPAWGAQPQGPGLFAVPRIVGGDYDLFPGGQPPFGSWRRRNFSPSHRDRGRGLWL